MLFLAAIPPAVEAVVTSMSITGCNNISSQVNFELSNLDSVTITLADGRPWDVVDAANNNVYSPARDFTITDVDAGSKISWSWNQKNSNGAPVAPGSYKIIIPVNRFSPNDGVNLEASFSIAADADEDCAPDASDACPYDATNSCKGEQVVQVVTKPIGNHFGCVPGTRLCGPIINDDDYDRDGANKEQGDKCERTSGPESNHYCPDYELKGAHAKEFIKQKEAALADTGWAWLFFAKAYLEVTSTQAKLDDANQRIAHDPPDSNYKEIAKLEVPQYVALPETDESNYLANMYAAAIDNYMAAANAFVHSNERFMGAQQAKDVEWTQTQAKMTRFYALKTADALKDINGALTEQELLMAKTGHNGILTKAKLQEFQNQIRANGVSALPKGEVEFAKNNLLMSDAEVAHLTDHILEVNPANWKEESTLDKIENYKEANNEFIISLENYAANVGANLRFVKVSDGMYELHVDNAPSDIVASMILLKVKSDGPLPSSAVVSAGDLPVKIKTAALSSDWQAIFLFSADGVKAGSSGVLVKISIPHEDGQAAQPEIAWLAGFPNWIVESRRDTVVDPSMIKFVSVAAAPSPPPSVSQTSVFKNGAWVWVADTTILPPSDSVKYYTAWWDGSAWITSQPPQYGVVWTGTGWSGTGPGTMPPKSIMYIDETTPAGKVNVWTGSQYVLADKTTVDATPLPSSWPVFDVGTKAWTFTSSMPPTSA